MQLKGKVLSTSFEDRELVGKDGVKKQSHISHIVLMMTDEKGAVEIANCRSFDFSGTLPKVQSDFITPPIKKYENYSGGVCEVLF